MPFIYFLHSSAVFVNLIPSFSVFSWCLPRRSAVIFYCSSIKLLLCQRNGSWSNKTQTGSKTSNTISVVILFVKRSNDQIILNDSTRNMLLCIKSHRNIDEHFQYLLKWTIKLNNASMVCMWITGKVFVQMNSSKGTTELQMITYIFSRLIVTKTGKITFYEKQWRILLVLWTIDIQNMWNQTFLWMCWRGRDRKRERDRERDEEHDTIHLSGIVSIMHFTINKFIVIENENCLNEGLCRRTCIRLDFSASYYTADIPTKYLDHGS